MKKMLTYLLEHGLIAATIVVNLIAAFVVTIFYLLIALVTSWYNKHIH